MVCTVFTCQFVMSSESGWKCKRSRHICRENERERRSEKEKDILTRAVMKEIHKLLVSIHSACSLNPIFRGKDWRCHWDAAPRGRKKILSVRDWTDVKICDKYAQGWGAYIQSRALASSSQQLRRNTFAHTDTCSSQPEPQGRCIHCLSQL